MTRRKPKKPDEKQLQFDLPITVPLPEQKLEPPRKPVWTENKAKLIERYLYYFVLVTHHGTYIDGFSGPQNADNSTSWTANLVLQSEPRWFRNFFLMDIDRQQVSRLRELRAAQPLTQPKRRIRVYQGDCNILIPKLLESKRVPREATFCLLDQRTFECEWSTVKALAEYKASPKIEIFYFLMNSWLNRAIAAQQDKQVIEKWWGRDDWHKLPKTYAIDRARWLSERFRNELGYASAKPWPIYEGPEGRRIMYFMIHATDHPAAPKLMGRAYNNAVMEKETAEQMEFWIKSELSGRMSP